MSVFLFSAHILNGCLYLKAFIQIFVLPVSSFSPFYTLYYELRHSSASRLSCVSGITPVMCVCHIHRASALMIDWCVCVCAVTCGCEVNAEWKCVLLKAPQRWFCGFCCVYFASWRTLERQGQPVLTDWLSLLLLEQHVCSHHTVGDDAQRLWSVLGSGI